MIAKAIKKDKYILSTVIISLAVAVLIHFPESVSLFDRFESHSLFPGMKFIDVANEILFTFLSLLLLFPSIPVWFISIRLPLKLQGQRFCFPLSWHGYWVTCQDSFLFSFTERLIFRPSMPWYIIICIHCGILLWHVSSPVVAASFILYSSSNWYLSRTNSFRQRISAISMKYWRISWTHTCCSTRWIPCVRWYAKIRIKRRITFRNSPGY